VDLGAATSISRVRLNWEAAYGSAYQIQVSNDNATWTTIKTVTGGTGGINDWTGLSGSGRYVRMYGTARGTAWGYSLWELEVYGGGASATATATATSTATATARPTATAAATSTATARPTAGSTLLSQAHPVTVSTTENAGTPGSAAVDGNTGTRWSSAFADPQWIYVDLGAADNVNRVVLHWEAAYGKAFQV